MSLIRPCAVGFGEVLWDALPHATLPGGAPANFAWQAGQFGAHGVVVSAVGDDVPGRELTQYLHQRGLDTDLIQTSSKRTGRVDVVVSAQHEPGYRIQDNSAWDAIEWTPALAELARRADCVSFGSLAQRSAASRDSLHRFLHATRPDCLRIFDVNIRHPLPARGIIAETMACTDVLKLNEDEWSIVAGELNLAQDWTRGCEQLFEQTHVRFVALTRGAQGSVLISEHEMLTLPAEPVELNDTIGAGDAFSAALAIGLLRGMSLREVQRVAAATAAFVCTQAGAMPTLPDAIKAMMNVPSGSVRLPSFRLRAPLNAAVPADIRPGEPAESH